MDTVSRTGLMILNTSYTSTFTRLGYRETIIDVSFATEHLSAHVRDWQVIDDYTASDCEFITFRVREDQPVEADPQVCHRRWNVAKKEVKKLSLVLERGQQSLVEIPEGVSVSERTELVISAMTRLIRRACQEAVPFKKASGRRRPCVLVDVRNNREQKRRRILTLRITEHQSAKKALSRAIQTNKYRCMENLQEDLNNDPWGRGYKVIMRNVGPFQKAHA